MAGDDPQRRVRDLGARWATMLDQLDDRATPLIAAGWHVIATGNDESWEFGDSVHRDYERQGERIELEYYEHGELVAYPLTDAPVGDEEGSAALFSVPASTSETAAAAFKERGWV